MNQISIFTLSLILISLILISAFFSCVETAVMAANRYRLRNLARKHHAGAIRILHLLQRPDRLLGVILIGNTFANIFASATATVIAVHLWGNISIALSSIVLTFIILIIAEITPKTFATVYPERTSLLASLPLYWLLKILYPLVWSANHIANSTLRLFNIRVGAKQRDPLTQEELRSIVHESSGKISTRHRSMLLNILDLDKLTVDDIMIPRHEIIGINIEHDWEKVLLQLRNNQHTRVPIYADNINNVLGIIHGRKALTLLAEQPLNKDSLLAACESPYFIPENTPLNLQLINFQKNKQRIGLVVDEYGDIQGLVTLEDILEEIVGEFTTDFPIKSKHIFAQKDGSYLVDGSISIRTLNRTLSWHLPTHGPKTLNGLITEHLEMIPQKNICLLIENYPIEIIDVEENTVSTAKISPNLRK